MLRRPSSLDISITADRCADDTVALCGRSLEIVRTLGEKTNPLVLLPRGPKSH
jgi:hypothetical protein